MPDLMTAPVSGTIRYHVHDSPIGALLLTARGGRLTGLHMEASNHPVAPGPDWVRDEEPFGEACRQLDEYFAGERREFRLLLAPGGTAFQRRVWAALCEIPFGETASYGDVARRIGAPRAVRGVGGANGRNPIAVVIPCHRVIASDGTLGGYGGGLERKRFLLDLEGALG